MNTPKMTFRRGGMREPKEGVTMSHAFQAPFHGVGGYIYIYVYIYIYIYIYKCRAPGPVSRPESRISARVFLDIEGPRTALAVHVPCQVLGSALGGPKWARNRVQMRLQKSAARALFSLAFFLASVFGKNPWPLGQAIASQQAAPRSLPTPSH